VVADFLWCAAYVPYHWHNAIEGHLTNEAWCMAVGYLAAICMALNATAGALMAVIMIHDDSSSGMVLTALLALDWIGMYMGCD
jgi:hypothetical protein